MKTSTVPIISSLALAAMSAAGISHWWSVRQFIGVVDAGLPVRSIQIPSTNPTKDAPRTPEKTASLLAKKNPSPTPAAAAAPDAHQKEFYEALISKMNTLQTQNQDLLDQLASTNRDVMNLEFRVDTHSKDFRPMPTTEDRPFTSLENDPGVLPPRAEPVMLPSNE